MIDTFPTKLLQVATIAETLRAFIVPHADYWKGKGWVVDGAASGAAEREEIVGHFDSLYSIDWSRNPLSLRSWTQALPSLRRLLVEGRYDIVHVHTPIAAFLTRLTVGSIPERRRPKVVYTAHGFHFHSRGGSLSNAVYIGLEKSVSRWTDRLVVINNEDYDRALKLKLVPPERLVYMPGIGVDVEVYGSQSHGSRDRLRQELGVADGTLLALMIAEFNPGKRHEDVVRAMASLPEAVCAFAGRGTLFESMKTLADELGVTDRIRFLGYRSDIPDLLGASDTVVLVSEREGLARSVMEAMTAGIPVIGSDARGIADLLEDGAGIIVPVGSPDAIADAMRRLASDPHYADLLGEAGRKRIQRFALPRVLEAHADLYEQLLAEGE